MKLVTPPLKINEDDPFANDALGRLDYANALLNIVSNSDDALVIALDAKWGEGKTTFVKMWQGLLNKYRVPNIYIDAFANDYVDDAFISVASAITSYAQENIEKSKKEKLSELTKKTIQVGGHLLSWSARIGIKAATLGIIKDSDIEELEDVKKELSKSASDLVGDFIEERINSHSKDIELIESFKTLLSELPSQLQQNENGKPLVIIIDELDRCKPTYAVELIEKIKHLFSVENVVFLLVMNKEQLEESIKSIYGVNIDAHTYLQKFVNLEMKLPKRNKDAFDISDTRKYAQKLIKEHQLERWNVHDRIITWVEPLAKHLNLSLRQLERVFTNLALFYASAKGDSPSPIIIFLATVKVSHPNLFNRFLREKVPFQDIKNELNLEQETTQEDHKFSMLIKWVRTVSINKIEHDEVFNTSPQDLADISSLLYEQYIEREEVLPFYAQKLSLFSVD